MGMNMANAGMMNTEAMGATGTSGCICMDGSTNPQCCGQGYDVTNPGVRPKREARIDNSFLDYENVDRQGDPVLTKGEADFQGSFGPFTRNRRMPGRHRRALEKYDVNYAQTNPGTARGMKDNPAFMTNTPPNMPANFANIDMSQYTPEQQEIINRKSKLLAMDWGERSFEQLYPGLLTKQDRKQIKNVRNALNWEPQQISLGYDVVKKDRPSEESPGSLDDNTYNRRQKGPKMGTSYPINQSNKFTWFSKNIGQHFKGQTEKQRYSPKLFQSRRIKGMQFGGNLLDGGLAQQEFNLNQGLNSQMRRGGKLCYGCGGAMHAYGGRIDGIPYATGGEILAGIGSGLYGIGEGILDTVTFGLTDELTDKGYEYLQEVGPMKGEDNVGDAIRGGANLAGATAGAVLTGGATTGTAISQGSKGAGEALGAIGEQTGNENLGKIGKGIEVGGQVAGMIVGDAGSAAKGASTAASTASDVADAAKVAESAGEAAQFGSKIGKIASNRAVQAGTQMASSALATAEQKAEAERLAEEERRKIERDMQMTNDPNSIYYNPAVARYGRKLGKGGGLWANIHAKRERIAAGSGERMRKPGSKGAPTAEALRNSQNAMGGHLYYPGGYLFGPAGEMPSTPIPDPIEKQDNTYGSDMPSSFIDMSTGTNPLGLVSPIYNLGMGLFGKESDLSYPLEKFTYKPFDFTESKNALRRQAAKALDSLRKTGNTNPSNILALKNLNAQTEAAYLERAENINAQREQAAADNNTKLMNKYNKELRELKLKNEAIKDEFIKAGLQDLVGFTEQERQNEYMFNFLKTMAPNVVTGSYNSIFDIFNRKDKKDKKD
jgi:hypothetical protein